MALSLPGVDPLKSISSAMNFLWVWVDLQEGIPLGRMCVLNFHLDGPLVATAKSPAGGQHSFILCVF